MLGLPVLIKNFAYGKNGQTEAERTIGQPDPHFFKIVIEKTIKFYLLDSVAGNTHISLNRT